MSLAESTINSSVSADLTSEPLQNTSSQKQVISIFDVASSLEHGLNDLLQKTEKSDQELQKKITEISKKLDKWEQESGQGSGRSSVASS